MTPRVPARNRSRKMSSARGLLSTPQRRQANAVRLALQIRKTPRAQQLRVEDALRKVRRGERVRERMKNGNATAKQTRADEKELAEAQEQLSTWAENARELLEVVPELEVRSAVVLREILEHTYLKDKQATLMRKARESEPFRIQLADALKRLITARTAYRQFQKAYLGHGRAVPEGAKEDGFGRVKELAEARIALQRLAG